MPLGAHQLTLIGSRNRAHLHLLSTTISRNHACIVLTKGGLYVRDLASRTGVILNGRKVKESDLHDGDLLQVGSFKFKFQDPAGSIRLPSSPRPPLAVLEVDGRSMTPLDERTILIGRRPGCDITLDSPAVSNTHAVIYECDGKRHVRDLGSRTGTQVNGTTVHHHPLELGDRITVGGTTFRYVAAEMPQLETTDANLPLEAELQPALTEEHEDHEPADLDFKEPAQAPAQGVIPLEHVDEEEQIPLTSEEPEPVSAEVDEVGQPHEEALPVELAPEELDAEHGGSDEMPAGAPLPGIEPHPDEIATAEDLSLDWEPHGQEDSHAQAANEAHEERPAGIDFANASTPAVPLVEPITELTSMGFPLLEPHSELPASPAGVIPAPADEAPAEPIDRALEVDEPVAEPQAVVSETEPASPEVEPVQAEPVAAHDESTASEPPGEAALATELPPVASETPKAAIEIPVESAEPVAAEPEASAIELADEVAAPNAGSEPTPEPVLDEIEPEPVVGVSEPTSDHGGITIDTADAAHVTGADEALPTDTEAEAELATPAVEHEAAITSGPEATEVPLRVEDVDLSAVSFDSRTDEADDAAEADESSAAPAPLLDLGAEPSVTEAGSATDFVGEPQTAAPEEKPKRKGRAKKRPGRARRKKDEPATGVEAAAAISGLEVEAALGGISLAAVEAASDAATTAGEDAVDAVSDGEGAALAKPQAAEPEESLSTTPEVASHAPATTDETPTDQASETPALEVPSEADHPVETVTSEEEHPSDVISSGEPAPVAPQTVELTADTADFETVAGEPALSTSAPLEPPVELTAPGPIAEETVVEETAVETIAPTEPTLESALDLEPSLEPEQSSDAAVPGEAETIEPADAALSDTAFGAAVRDFSGPDLGPLVEEAPAAARAPEIADEPAAPPVAAETEAVAHEAEPEPEPAPAPGAATLSPLGDAELPPLELGPELTFGGEEKPVAQAEAQQPARVDDALQLSDLDSLDETPAVAAPLALGAATEIQLDLHEGLDAKSSDESGLEFGETEGLDEALPPIELGEEGLDFETAPFAKPQAAEAVAEPKGELDLALPTNAEEPESAPAPIEPEAPAGPPAQPAAAPRPPLDPFFGMGRDMGSFIGGMPLALNTAPTAAAPAAVAPATPTAATPAVATPTSSPIAAPTGAAPTSGRPPAESLADVDLDKLFEGEEPLELFDETADQLDKLPDSLAPIADESDVLAEPKAGPATSPQEQAGAQQRGPSTPPAAPTAPATLRTLTADPASVAPPPPARTNMAIPPFAGARPAARPGRQAFTGMRGVRPSEVFSQTTLPPLDESAFKPQPIEGGPAVPTQPGHVPQPTGGGGLRPSEALAAASAARPVAPKAHERPVGAAQGGGGSGSHGSQRPWWRNFRVLLPLLIVLLAAAVAAIIYFFPPRTLVQGTLQIKGTDNGAADVWARHDQVTQVREAIMKPELRDAVLSRLRAENLPPGFAQDASAFRQLADPSNSPFENGRLTLKRAETDPQDPQRMQAILQAVYLENQTPAEQKLPDRQQADDAQRTVNDLLNRLNAQREQVKKLSDDLVVKAGGAAQSVLGDSAAAVDALQKQGVALQKALDEAQAEVSRRHDAWDAAQSASQKTVVDPKVTQLRQNLATLNAQLAVAKVARSGRVDPAAAFDETVQELGDELSMIATATAGAKDSPLAAYATSAHSAAAEIHSRIAQQKQDAGQIAELRRELAEHREAHLRQVWEADDTLKDLLQRRDEDAHHYAAATESGYTEDANRLRGVLEQLDQKIEDRRQSLATSGQSSDDLQQKLEQTIQRLEGDRQQNETRIVQAIDKLKIPSTTKISPADNATLVDVARNVAAAQAQHEAYAAELTGKRPAGADPDAEIQKLEARIAEQQAQLDAYQQRPDAPAQVAAARQAMDAAQDAQAKAQNAFTENVNELMLARQYRDEQKKLDELSKDYENAQRQAQGQLAQAAAVPVVLPPDPQTAVQVTRDADQRVTYLVAALGLIVAIFAVPLWLAARDPREDVPYAQVMAESREAFGQRTSDLGDDDDVLPDEEHAALT
jgi:pSer/pThr/pTyr-binding forkhead associated (FHA) protein